MANRPRLIALGLIVLALGYSASSPQSWGSLANTFIFTSPTKVVEQMPTCKWQSALRSENAFLSLYFASEDLAIATGAEERFWITTNGGRTWASRSISRVMEDPRRGEYDLVKAIITPSKVIYAIGHLEDGGSAVFTSPNLGESWSVKYFDDCSINDVSTISDEVWAIGHTSSSNGFIHSFLLHTLGGMDWKTIWRSDKEEVLLGVHFATLSQGLLVGSNGLIKRTSDGGRKFTNEKSPTNKTLEEVMFRDSNNGYAVGQGGVVIRTTDGGRTWTKRLDSHRSNFSSLTIDYRGGVWVAGEEGALLISTDNGTRWDSIQIPTQEDIHSLASFGKTVWVALSDGRILACDNFRR